MFITQQDAFFTTVSMVASVVLFISSRFLIYRYSNSMIIGFALIDNHSNNFA